MVPIVAPIDYVHLPLLSFSYDCITRGVTTDASTLLTHGDHAVPEHSFFRLFVLFECFSHLLSIADDKRAELFVGPHMVSRDLCVNHPMVLVFRERRH